MNEPGIPFMIHAAVGTALCLLFVLFAWTSLREAKPRAAWASLLCFAFTHQSIVDENRYQLVSYRTMREHCTNGRVNPT